MCIFFVWIILSKVELPNGLPVAFLIEYLQQNLIDEFHRYSRRTKSTAVFQPGGIEMTIFPWALSTTYLGSSAMIAEGCFQRVLGVLEGYTRPRTPFKTFFEPTVAVMVSDQSEEEVIERPTDWR